MIRTACLALIGFSLIGVQFGCHDNTPPPPRVPVPGARAPDREAFREYERPKPIEVSAPPVQGGLYEDEPLLTQRPPEQRAFIEAYGRVGRPRITVFVNRTMEGDIIPVRDNEPLLSVEQTRRSSTGVNVQQNSTYTRRDYWGDDRAQHTDKFESKGPAEYRERTEVRTAAGKYDEINARALDYEAVENIMSDWLAANGQTILIAPIMARQRLTDEQIKDLQSGRPVMLSEIAQQLGADVLVQVQARPSRQVGYAVRMVAEAINIRGGQSIGRAVVDVPPPLDKPQINKYTRFLARKLMDDMTGTWGAMSMAPVAPPPPATRP